MSRIAGVSIKTVSRVVNKEPNVSPTTQESAAAIGAQLQAILRGIWPASAPTDRSRVR